MALIEKSCMNARTGHYDIFQYYTNGIHAWKIQVNRKSIRYLKPRIFLLYVNFYLKIILKLLNWINKTKDKLKNIFENHMNKIWIKF